MAAGLDIGLHPRGGRRPLRARRRAASAPPSAPSRCRGRCLGCSRSSSHRGTSDGHVLALVAGGRSPSRGSSSPGSCSGPCARRPSAARWSPSSASSLDGPGRRGRGAGLRLLGRAPAARSPSATPLAGAHRPRHGLDRAPPRRHAQEGGHPGARLPRPRERRSSSSACCSPRSCRSWSRRGCCSTSSPAVFVMGIVMFHINREFSSLDTEQLTALKD